MPADPVTADPVPADPVTADPVVTVRYWAAARAAAGVAEEQVRAATLAGVLGEIRFRHADRDRFAAVLDSCSILIDGVQARTADPTVVRLSAGARVECLPPFAGG